MLLVCGVFSKTGEAREKQDEKQEKYLKQKATRQKWYLDYALKRDGFASCRLALNLWKEASMEAGVFDLDAYQSYKKEIYGRAISGILNWFEVSIREEWPTEAELSRNIYRLRANETGQFDPELDENMEKRIAELMERIQQKKAEKKEEEK